MIVGGFYVEVFVNGRFAVLRWYPTRTEAERERQRLVTNGFWKIRPPRVTSSL